MSLPQSFLDELRARTTLSALIGRALKLERAGSEFKACCPFHNEKTASFYVNDDKGFYHCFGCQAHGDAIRWLTDHDGLDFIEAVRQLAEGAGLAMPPRSAEAERRDEKAAEQSDVLERAAAWYRERLAGDAKAQAFLEARGISAEAAAKFGLGFAPPKASVASCGVATAALEAAGLLIAGTGRQEGLWLDRFRGRLMIPIHDGRGRLIAFAGRLIGEGDGKASKYINSPESAAFDKGATLFNLHRAAPAARKARRFVIVEGQFDAIALDEAGISEVAAPQGSALTPRQLERAWRASECPILLLDGDAAGRKAALKAAERAMPMLGPGRSLKVALLAEGEDPDTIVRSAATLDEGRAAIEAVLEAAEPLSAFVWRALSATGDTATPEGRASLWKRLAALAGAIGDAETRAQYLADWRRRFDDAFPPPPPGLTDAEMLPDGRVAALSNVGEAERERLSSVAAAWLARQEGRWEHHWAVTPAGAGRDAWELGRRAGAGLIGEADAEAALNRLQGALLNHWPEADARQLANAMDYGRKRSASLIDALRLEHRCALYHRTDKGNSERWIARFGQDYLYTTAKGWLGWDRRRYRVLNQEKDTTPAEVLASVVTMVEAIQREADFIRDTGWPEDEEIKPDLLDALEQDPRRPGGLDRLIPGGKKAERLSEKLRAWALSSEAAGRINCIPGLAKRAVTVELDTFDTDPMLLNCLNGTLVFHRPDPESGEGARVELRPHDRADRLTRLTACAYDPDAPAPRFAALVKWAQPDRGRRRYLRQWLGYNLTGDMGEQIFHIWYGPLAANGKSTVGNACREAIGDYGDAGKAETFLDVGINKRGDAATPDIVRLPGIRMVTAGEPKPGLAIDEPLINGITGGDPMLARDNFRSFFRFLPVFKFTLWCNELPPIPRGTAGIWRRVKVMPWEQHLEEHERDGALPEKLRAEHAGILAWMVRGCLDWMEHGFVEPESVQLASADYKHDSDPLSIFLNTCTAQDPEGRVQSSRLYETFCAWAKAAGETEWKQKGFSQALKSKGFASKSSNGIHWLGLKLIKEPGDFVDHEGRVLSLDESAGSPGSARAPPAPPPVDGDDFVPGFDDDMP